MISHILQMLQIGDFYGESEFIDIAKGKYKIPTTFKEALKQEKRWRKKKK